MESFQFLWQLILILFAVKIAGHLSKKMGQPAVFGELLVGIILGPALLGWLTIDPQEGGMLKSLAEIGVILLMFLAGLETDVNEFRKSASSSTMVALGGVILPLIAGFGVGLAFGYSYQTSIFVGTLLVATSVSISVQTLRELGKLQSKEGITILGEQYLMMYSVSLSYPSSLDLRLLLAGRRNGSNSASHQDYCLFPHHYPHWTKVAPTYFSVGQ